MSSTLDRYTYESVGKCANTICSFFIFILKNPPFNLRRLEGTRRLILETAAASFLTVSWRANVVVVADNTGSVHFWNSKVNYGCKFNRHSSIQTYKYMQTNLKAGRNYICLYPLCCCFLLVLYSRASDNRAIYTWLRLDSFANLPHAIVPEFKS